MIDEHPFRHERNVILPDAVAAEVMQAGTSGKEVIHHVGELAEDLPLVVAGIAGRDEIWRIAVILVPNDSGSYASHLAELGKLSSQGVGV